MSFSKEAIENNYFSDDELELLYLKNIENIKNRHYNNTFDFENLLKKFKEYKIIGFNYESTNFSSGCASCMIQYIVFVDIFGNCYGQIQPLYIEGNECGSISWQHQLFNELLIRSFKEIKKSIKTEIPLFFIQHCIKQNLLLNYSFPEYNILFQKYKKIKTTKSGKRFDGYEFNDFIDIDQKSFKNIFERYETDYRKIDQEERNFCREKTDSLKEKYGDNFYFKHDEINYFKIIIGNSTSEIVNLEEILDFNIKKILVNGKIINKKYGDTNEIVIENCLNLKKIIIQVEGINNIRLYNCPNIKEIDNFENLNLFIDDVSIQNIIDKENTQTELFNKLLVELQELRKFREGVDTHYPAMIELLRQRIEKLEKS